MTVALGGGAAARTSTAPLLAPTGLHKSFGRTPALDGASIAGVGAVVVLGVTGLSMPALWRLMRPDGLRTE